MLPLIYIQLQRTSIVQVTCSFEFLRRRSDQAESMQLGSRFPQLRYWVAMQIDLDGGFPGRLAVPDLAGIKWMGSLSSLTQAGSRSSLSELLACHRAWLPCGSEPYGMDSGDGFVSHFRSLGSQATCLITSHIFRAA